MTRSKSPAMSRGPRIDMTIKDVFFTLVRYSRFMMSRILFTAVPQ
jgi:hypothetical protein